MSLRPGGAHPSSPQSWGGGAEHHMNPRLQRLCSSPCDAVVGVRGPAFQGTKVTPPKTEKSPDLAHYSSKRAHFIKMKNIGNYEKKIRPP